MGNQAEVNCATGFPIIYFLILLTGHFNLSIIPGRVGVPEGRLSGFEKFEALMHRSGRLHRLAGYGANVAVACVRGPTIGDTTTTQ